MIRKDKIKVVAFDADDTLWDCQGHFEQVMQQLYEMLVPWTGSREASSRELFATERKNMPLLGFGTKAFTLSVLETAMHASHFQMPTEQLAQLQRLCYTLLELPATPLPEVKETLAALAVRGGQPLCLVAFTKGELLDQEHKLQRSGLLPYFDHVEITSDKGEAEFRSLCRKLGIAEEQLLMVGNSLKSDIAPALSVGAQAVYIPFHVTWELEFHDNFEHERMVQIAHFGELLSLLS